MNPSHESILMKCILFINLFGVVLSTCPEQLLNQTGVCGSGAFVTNVSDVQSCCALCHSPEHSATCVGWTFGFTSSSDKSMAAFKYPTHNCALTPVIYGPRSVSEHISGVVSMPPAIPCNEDQQCMLSSTTSWRCLHASLTPTPSNNCHLPGPGTAGNSTCSCQTPKCALGPALPKNESLTQYLMIGDSISLGMYKYVKANLTSASVGYEVTHNPGNANSVNWGSHCLNGWTRSVDIVPRKWDVISFNFGLHDLGYDTERLSIDQYGLLLANITDRLVSLQKRDGTKLLWVDTTPVPTVPVYDAGGPCNTTKKCLNPPRYDNDVDLFNKKAHQVIADAKSSGASISSLDLYTFVIEKCGGKGYSHCDGFQLPNNVHYTDNGWKALSSLMIKAVLKLS